MSRRIFFYDDLDIVRRHNLELVPGPVEKVGPVAWTDKPAKGDRRAVFCGSLVGPPVSTAIFARG